MGERSAQTAEKRRTDRKLGPGAVCCRFSQPQLDVEPRVNELPGNEFGWPDLEDDEHSGDIDL